MVRHCVSHIVRTLPMSWIIKESNMTSLQSKSWHTGRRSNGNFWCDPCEQLVLESNRTSLRRRIRDQLVTIGSSVSLWIEISGKVRILMIMTSFLRVCGTMKFLCGHNRNIINSFKHFLTKSVAPSLKVTGMSLTVNSSPNFVLTCMLLLLSCRWIESKNELFVLTTDILHLLLSIGWRKWMMKQFSHIVNFMSRVKHTNNLQRRSWRWLPIMRRLMSRLSILQFWTNLPKQQALHEAMKWKLFDSKSKVQTIVVSQVGKFSDNFFNLSKIRTHTKCVLDFISLRIVRIWSGHFLKWFMTKSMLKT